MTRGRLGPFVLLLIILVLPDSGPAQPSLPAERRIALVIGISAYQNAPLLANPKNDVRDIGEALRRRILI
jgi:hypothetical protein